MTHRRIDVDPDGKTFGFSPEADESLVVDSKHIVCAYGEANDDLEHCEDGRDWDDDERPWTDRMWRVGSPDLVSPDGSPLMFTPVCSYHLPWLLPEMYASGEGAQLVVPLDGLPQEAEDAEAPLLAEVFVEEGN